MTGLAGDRRMACRGSRCQRLVGRRSSDEEESGVTGKNWDEICPTTRGCGPCTCRTALAATKVLCTLREGNWITIQWSGELRTVVVELTGDRTGVALRDLTEAESLEMERERP
jgi:hypothetical protein